MHSQTNDLWGAHRPRLTVYSDASLTHCGYLSQHSASVCYLRVRISKVPVFHWEQQEQPLRILNTTLNTENLDVNEQVKAKVAVRTISLFFPCNCTFLEIVWKSWTLNMRGTVGWRMRRQPNVQPVCAVCRRSVNSEILEVCGGNGDVWCFFFCFFSHAGSFWA